MWHDSLPALWSQQSARGPSRNAFTSGSTWTRHKARIGLGLDWWQHKCRLNSLVAGESVHLMTSTASTLFSLALGTKTGLSGIVSCHTDDFSSRVIVCGFCADMGRRPPIIRVFWRDQCFADWIWSAVLGRVCTLVDLWLPSMCIDGRKGKFDHYP